MMNGLIGIMGNGVATRWVPWSMAGALLVACAAAASPSAAAELDSIAPAEASVGTPIEVRLTDYAGKGKPAVWLTLADEVAAKAKKTKLRVASVTDLGGGVTSLSVSFKKAKTGAGVYDLHVRPKGKGPVEDVFLGAITVRAPSVDSVTPDQAESKGQVTISGTFLGGAAKRPKVQLVPVAGGRSKKGKVVQVGGDSSLTVKLPKLPAGLYDVSVTNSVGHAVLPAALTITASGGSGGGGGKDLVTATLGSDVQALLATQFSATDKADQVAAAFSRTGPDGPLVAITAGMSVGKEVVSFSMGFNFDAGTTPTPFTIDSNDLDTGFTIAASQTSPDVSWYEGDGVPGTFTVTSATSKRIQGTFTFDIPPGRVDPAASSLEMTNGTFDVTIEKN